MVKKKGLVADQSILVIDKSGNIGSVKAKAKVEYVYKAKLLMCPYCLFQAPVSKFLIKLKSGVYSEKRGMCSDCGKVMNMRTLTMEMTVEKFAEWVLDTMAWERISFDKFRTRLKEMGIAWQFWEHYKKYKKEQMEESPSYEQYLENQQRELAKEEGYYIDEHD